MSCAPERAASSVSGGNGEDRDRADPAAKLDDPAALVLVLASTAGRWRDEARYATLQSNLLRVELERERSLRIEYEARIAELRTAVEIDDLTHVATRVAFDQRFNDEWARARRAVEPVAVLMLDLDAFKALNDEYGHAKGDEALSAVGGVLLEHQRRPGDLASRRGGDEFAMVLPNTDLLAAEAIAEGIRQAVVNLQIANQRSAYAEMLSVTIGVAAVVPGATLGPHDLLATADQALYAAKEAGRNRVQGIELFDAPVQRRATLQSPDARDLAVERLIEEGREREAELDPDAFRVQHLHETTPEGVYENALNQDDDDTPDLEPADDRDPEIERPRRRRL
jgi:diguanylate cyclase (GGDEF)-like protein